MKKTANRINKVICFLPFYLFTFLIFTGCADTDMTSLAVSEPDSLSATDYLKQYGALKDYTSMNVGTAVSPTTYDSKNLDYRMLAYTFSEVQPSDLFTHEKLVDAEGSIDTTTAATFLNAANSVGQKVFGSYLCSYKGQNSDYLNEIIKPVVYKKDGSELTSRCIVAANAISGEAKSQQFEFAFTRTPSVKPNLEYEFVFRVRGTRAGKFSVSVAGGGDFTPQVSVTTNWKKVTIHTVMKSGIYNLRSVVFNIGSYVGTLYIDNLELYEIDEYGDRSKNKLTTNADLDDAEATTASLTKVDGTSDGITKLAVSELGDGYDPDTYTVEKTAEEKASLLTTALTSFVTETVNDFKDNVNAWSVVAYSFSVDSTATDFYWQDYLGQGYAVTAFKAARQAGGNNLFITDSISKASELIDFVAFIESQGVTVDGYDVIVDDNDANIQQFMPQLAATGKLVRLSGISASTADSYSAILNAYMQAIPAAQRYGISLQSSSLLWNDNVDRTKVYGAIADAIKQ